MGLVVTTKTDGTWIELTSGWGPASWFSTSARVRRYLHLGPRFVRYIESDVGVCWHYGWSEVGYANEDTGSLVLSGPKGEFLRSIEVGLHAQRDLQKVARVVRRSVDRFKGGIAACDMAQRDATLLFVHKLARRDT